MQRRDCNVGIRKNWGGSMLDMVSLLKNHC